jgi:hypothetical protein
MRLAVPLAIVALTLALLSGCGSSDGDSDSASVPQPTPKASGSPAPAGAAAHSCAVKAGSASGLRATGIPCERAKRLAAAWVRNKGCAPADGASRSSCKLEGDYDCLTAVTDRGLAVSCARPGSSVAFTVKS